MTQTYWPIDEVFLASFESKYQEINFIIVAICLNNLIYY